jgi:predicted dehydrogenase
MSRLKLGVVGAGLIGTTHIKIAREIPEFDLVGIADPDPAARVIAEQYGPALYKSHKDLLADAKPDAVIIATPTQLHAPVGIDCVRAGAHILVEKPIADTVEAANRLNAEAQRTGRIILVGHHRRYFRHAKKPGVLCRAVK